MKDINKITFSDNLRANELNQTIVKFRELENDDNTGNRGRKCRERTIFRK